MNGERARFRRKTDRRIADFILGKLSRPFVVVTSLIDPWSSLARVLGKMLAALIKAAVETYVGHMVILSRGEGGAPDIHVTSAMRAYYSSTRIYLTYVYTEHVYRHLRTRVS